MKFVVRYASKSAAIGCRVDGDEFQYWDFRDSNTHPRKSADALNRGDFCGRRGSPGTPERRHRRFFILAPYPGSLRGLRAGRVVPPLRGQAAGVRRVRRLRAGNPRRSAGGAAVCRGGSARVAPVGLALVGGLRCRLTQTQRGGCLGSPVGLALPKRKGLPRAQFGFPPWALDSPAACATSNAPANKGNSPASNYARKLLTNYL